MSTATLVAKRAAVRLREERYYRLHKYHVRKGRKLKKGTPQQKKNAESRKWYGTHYLAARKRRRALDVQIAKQPITQVDQAGIDFIIKEEGVVLHPYNDSRGFATVGVGHLLHPSGVTEADNARWGHMSRHDADVLLARDLDRFEAVVADAFRSGTVTVTHNRFNAATSLAFNIGSAGFAGSSVARLIRSGDLHGAADAFRMWSTPSVLRARRERERNLFLS